MKKYFILLFLVIFNFGCEKVIEIDLNFNEENYVIDAKINKHVNSDKAFSEVRISKSRPYSVSYTHLTLPTICSV